jgi:hypothetical protein
MFMLTLFGSINRCLALGIGLSSFLAGLILSLSIVELFHYVADTPVQRLSGVRRCCKMANRWTDRITGLTRLSTVNLSVSTFWYDLLVLKTGLAVVS